MKICFPCQPGRSQECRNKSRDLKGFDIVGYEECVEWSEALDSIPEKNESGWWMRLDEMPSMSEHRVIHVQKPFNEVMGCSFWTFYVPALSSINGLQEYMQEIEHSAFVKCKIVSVLYSDDTEAWIQVLVSEVKPLKEFSNLLGRRYEEVPVWKQIYDLEYDYMVRYKDWIYYSGYEQGDMCNWLIIKIVDNNPYLVALGESEFHQDTAYMCNMVLSNQTYARVLQANEIV